MNQPSSTWFLVALVVGYFVYLFIRMIVLPRLKEDFRSDVLPLPDPDSPEFVFTLLISSLESFANDIEDRPVAIRVQGYREMIPEMENVENALNDSAFRILKSIDRKRLECLKLDLPEFRQQILVELAHFSGDPDHKTPFETLKKLKKKASGIVDDALFFSAFLERRTALKEHLKPDASEAKPSDIEP